MNPVILASDAQHVTFTVTEKDKTLAFSTIYASTNYQTRRTLWNNLNTLQSQHDLPWCFIGDFNVILGAHEHRGRTPHARLPMEDFKQWPDSNNLIHLPTSGAAFTWENGRGGCRHTDKRLDRVIYNQSWLDLCHSLSVSTLTKHTSDHYPLLLNLKLSNTPFVSQFKFLRMWTLHPECDSLVKDRWNTEFVGCPMYILTRKLKLLKEKLKSWNKETFGNVHDYVTTAETKLQQIGMSVVKVFWF
jgi:hypothetical protein